MIAENMKFDFGCHFEDATVDVCEPSVLSAFEQTTQEIHEHNDWHLIKLYHFVVSNLELTQEMSNKAFGGTTTISDGDSPGRMKLKGFKVQFGYTTKGNWFTGSLKVIYYYASSKQGDMHQGAVSNIRTIDYEQEQYADTVNGKFHSLLEGNKK